MDLGGRGANQIFGTLCFKVSFDNFVIITSIKHPCNFVHPLTSSTVLTFENIVQLYHTAIPSLFRFCEFSKDEYWEKNCRSL